MQSFSCGWQLLVYWLFVSEELPPEIANIHHCGTRLIQLADKCFNGTFSVGSALSSSEFPRAANAGTTFSEHLLSAFKRFSFPLSANRRVMSAAEKA